MATKQATKRLTREYQDIRKNPPPYIIAHPSENNILEWHYILTGPEKTPYEGGQYWGTLVFPSDYPFAPPAIRMHTPSGRFQPSTRLCLSISDFHPKQWNPAWTVSTALTGLLSFMTSEELTTGSIGAHEAERKWHSARSRWWNATGGGSSVRAAATGQAARTTPGNIKAGDGGAKFRSEWPELDEENWKWIKDNHIDPQTGKAMELPNSATESSCSPETAALRKRLGATSGGVAGVVQGGRDAARNAGQGWLSRNKIWVGVGVLFAYVLLSRVFVEGDM